MAILQYHCIHAVQVELVKTSSEFRRAYTQVLQT